MQTVTNREVSKDQVFKLRLDAEDRKRLDDLAEHYSSTAATVVRILIKKEHDAFRAQQPQEIFDPIAMLRSDDRRESYVDLLLAMRDEASEHEGATRDEISRRMNEKGYGHQWKGWKAFPRMLNELVRAGYCERRLGGYVLTTKGVALFTPDAAD